jgi:hypothetical protein
LLRLELPLLELLLRPDELRLEPLLDLLLLERVPLAPILLLELPLPVFLVGMVFSIHFPLRDQTIGHKQVFQVHGTTSVRAG